MTVCTALNTVHTVTAGHIIGMINKRGPAARDNTGGPNGQGKVTVREEWAVRWGNGVVTPPYDHRDQAERRRLVYGAEYPALPAMSTVVCRTVTVTDWAAAPVSVVPEPSVKREPAVGTRVRMRHFPSITGTVISCFTPSIRVQWDHDSRVRELALNLVEPETP